MLQSVGSQRRLALSIIMLLLGTVLACQYGSFSTPQASVIPPEPTAVPTQPPAMPTAPVSPAPRELPPVEAPAILVPITANNAGQVVALTTFLEAHDGANPVL